MKKLILLVKQIFVKENANGNAEQKPTIDEGDFVQLVWMIEKLRHPENKCTMNELIEEVNKSFDGLEGVRKKLWQQ
jgi:hypothetical protein